MASTALLVAVPAIGIANLAAVTACTTRAPVATANLASSNLVALTAATTLGLRVDSIEVQAASTSITGASVAALVGIWMWDGTNATLIQEIAVTAVTPSATTAAFTTTITFANPIGVPPTHRLYASTTVTTTAGANALSVLAFGGSF